MGKWECTPVSTLNLGSLELTAMNVREKVKEARKEENRKRVDL